MKRRLAAATTGAMLLVAGCGSSGPTDATPVPSSTDVHDSWDVSQMPDPCRTVTLAEVGAVLAEPVDPGTRLASWPPLCSFVMPGPPQEFLYVSDDSRPAARDDFDRQRTDSSTTETVEGIGDRAYWLPEFTTLHVFAGRTHLTVKFAGPRPPHDTRAKAVALARVALPRAVA